MEDAAVLQTIENDREIRWEAALKEQLRTFVKKKLSCNIISGGETND